MLWIVSVGLFVILILLAHRLVSRPVDLGTVSLTSERTAMLINAKKRQDTERH